MLAFFLAVIAAQPAAQVKAPIAHVTVFGDRARVTRVGQLPVDGQARAEFPLLPDSVDAASVRVEASGAEVQKVDLQLVDSDEFPADQARAILGQLEKLDDAFSLAAMQRSDLQAQLVSLRRIAPRVQDEPLKPRPKLTPKAYGEALAFVPGEEQGLQGRIREQEEKLRKLSEERATVAARGRVLGGAQRRTGLRVTAQLAGHGTARLTLTYAASNARWSPVYDLNLGADQKSVLVLFGGSTGQETGEDWVDAELTLSTAVPAGLRALPELATWKIGERERFIPTARRAERPPPPAPPPAAEPPEAQPSRSEELRDRLSQKVESAPSAAADAATPVELGVSVGGAGAVAHGARGGRSAVGRGAPSPPPAAAPKFYESSTSVEEQHVGPATRAQAEGPARAMAVARKSAGAADDRGPPASPPDQVGIAPPPAWSPPPPLPESPSARAGGQDLEFTSLHRETVRSGGGGQRVLLFTERWPVTTERLLFPSLAPDAYLVAQMKNPSQRTLPRAPASLSVGEDPTGTAELPLVAPGQELTLPLGIDRALRPIRNVAQVQSERGLFTKDEVTRYAVTIEVANPYQTPIPLHVVDQVPVQGDKNVEVSLVDAGGAEREEGTGKLTWRITAPAAGKVKLQFVYDLKRQKGYRVHQ